MISRDRLMHILQLESELQEIVRLVGIDSLSPEDRLTLETAQMIREDFLQQNAFSDTDSFTPIDKQARLLKIILDYNELSKTALTAGVALEDIFGISARERIGRAKDIPADEYGEQYKNIESLMHSEIEKLMAKEGK